MDKIPVFKHAGQKGHAIDKTVASFMRDNNVTQCSVEVFNRAGTMVRLNYYAESHYIPDTGDKRVG
jgi:hypothetical protein